MSVFDEAFRITVSHEGAYDRTAADPGNWTGGAVGSGELRGTKFGISAAAFPKRDIAGLTIDDARAIYLEQYWRPIQGDSLPGPLAALVFDAAVNNGVSRAIRWLQTTVGAIVDGVIGPATLAAVDKVSKETGGASVCAEFQAQRLVFMASLPTWRTFGVGWARRLCALPYQIMTAGG